MPSDASGRPWLTSASTMAPASTAARIHPTSLPNTSPRAPGRERGNEHVGPVGAVHEPGHAAEPGGEVAHVTVAHRCPQRVAAHHGADVGEGLGVVDVDRRGHAPPEEHADAADRACGVGELRSHAERRPATVGDGDQRAAVEMPFDGFAHGRSAAKPAASTGVIASCAQ